MNARRRASALNALSAAAAAQDAEALAALTTQHVGEVSVLDAALKHVRAVGEACRADERSLPLRAAKALIAAGVAALRTHARGDAELLADVADELLALPMEVCDKEHTDELAAVFVDASGFEPLFAAMRRHPSLGPRGLLRADGAGAGAFAACARSGAAGGRRGRVDGAVVDG
jgi:hypothetical protein